MLLCAPLEVTVSGNQGVLEQELQQQTEKPADKDLLNIYDTITTHMKSLFYSRVTLLQQSLLVLWTDWLEGSGKQGQHTVLEKQAKRPVSQQGMV